MLTLLDTVARQLATRRMPYALIGAGAMAVHGVVRGTDDLDLLVADPAAFAEDCWKDLQALGVGVEIRRGDDSDPLAGIVRFTQAPAEPVDLVVGRQSWMAELLARAVPFRLGDLDVPTVTPSDLVLLKLYAGGAQDLFDIQQLLEAGDERTIRAAVDGVIHRLPADARAAWRALSRKHDLER